MLPLLGLRLAADWVDATERLTKLGRAGLLALYVVLTTASVELQVVKHLARWVRNGEFWLPQFGDGGDAGATALHFLAWAFPHPVAAVLVLAAGLAAAWAVGRRAQTAP
jgi:hypothetical protein